MPRSKQRPTLGQRAERQTVFSPFSLSRASTFLKDTPFPTRTLSQRGRRRRSPSGPTAEMVLCLVLVSHRSVLRAVPEEIRQRPGQCRMPGVMVQQLLHNRLDKDTPDAGAYLLVIRLSRPARVRFGARGLLRLEQGILRLCRPGIPRPARQAQPLPGYRRGKAPSLPAPLARGLSPGPSIFVDHQHLAR